MVWVIPEHFFFNLAQFFAYTVQCTPDPELCKKIRRYLAVGDYFCSSAGKIALIVTGPQVVATARLVTRYRNLNTHVFERRKEIHPISKCIMFTKFL